MFIHLRIVSHLDVVHASPCADGQLHVALDVVDDKQGKDALFVALDAWMPRRLLPETDGSWSNGQASKCAGHEQTWLHRPQLCIQS